MSHRDRFPSHSWQVILERRSSDPTVPCTFEFFAPQRSGNELIIERRGVRSVCRFCLNTSHTREGCRHKRPAMGPPAGGNTRTGGSGSRRRRRRPSQRQPKATSSVQAPAPDTSSTTTIIPPPSITSPPAPAQAMETEPSPPVTTPPVSTQAMAADPPASLHALSANRYFGLSEDFSLAPRTNWADTSVLHMERRPFGPGVPVARPPSQDVFNQASPSILAARTIASPGRPSSRTSTRSEPGQGGGPGVT
jgi:hypothetical protein